MSHFPCTSCTTTNQLYTTNSTWLTRSGVHSYNFRPDQLQRLKSPSKLRRQQALLSAVPCTCSWDPEEAPAFTSQETTAGIPVADSTTDVGARLWSCLRDRPAELATTVVHELSNIASCTERTETHKAVDEPVAEALVDTLYTWAIAEAYCQHPLIQESLRAVLCRPGVAPLAQGEDVKHMASEVQLLRGREGQYRLGSVRFTAPAAQPSNIERRRGSFMSGWSAFATPLLEEAQTPRPIKRADAACTYHLYLYCGYFNRHMSLRKQRERLVFGNCSRVDPTVGLPRNASSVSRLSTPYGTISKLWRYFENVPDELSDMRTKEAATAADRHVRALFGDEVECLTFLSSWQNMCEEAKWFGRALYDAEEVVTRHCATAMTQQWR